MTEPVKVRWMVLVVYFLFMLNMQLFILSFGIGKILQLLEAMAAK